MSESLKRHLEMEKAFGVDAIPVSAIQRQAAPPSASPVRGGTAPAGAGKRAQLEFLESQFKNCMNCALSATRTQVVFGSGDPEAQLMFIGEAPGFDEDRQGQPFVGAAGQLLTKIIEAMKLTREKVYIANVLKCRPPGNRNPLPTEVIACNPILERQIEIIQPKIICALGKFAAQTLLNSQEPITRMRGRFFERNGIKVMPTFHPAYLLRNPDDKKLVWEDAKQIMREMGIL